MAIYHLEAKIVTRGVGRTACGAAAYMSCSRIYNDYDGIQHDYTRKSGLVWENIFLPLMAPVAWQDRETLWNAVEASEKTKDSRLAREFVAALPVELGREQWINLLTEFIQNNFVAEGMCADVAIHDTDGHNPHAHILLTVRPLNEDGTWQHKTEKEYLCILDGEERGFTAAEFKTAQTEGWEKQYQYKVGKKKVYMTPSAAEAQGLERVSKYPKSTKYGRQNPITVRWNNEEQLIFWRTAWADMSNRYLEQAGREERIDHRSHVERGLDEKPTIHEGYEARKMEKMGVVSERCELNREIKADNALLRGLKSLVEKLTDAVKNGILVIAEAMETARQKMIIFQYHLLHIKSGKTQIDNILQVIRPDMKQYEDIVKQLNAKIRERQKLLEEKKATSPVHVFRHRELAKKIVALTDDIEKLKSEKILLLNQFDVTGDHDMAEVKLRIASMETSWEKLDRQEQKYSVDLDKALTEYGSLIEQAAGMDTVEVDAARQTIRLDKERETIHRLQDTYGKRFDSGMLTQGRKEVAKMLNEAAEPVSIRQKLQHPYEQPGKQHHTSEHHQER